MQETKPNGLWTNVLQWLKEKKEQFLMIYSDTLESEPFRLYCICKIFNLKKWLGCITLESIFDDSGTVSLLLSSLRKILLYVLC